MFDIDNFAAGLIPNAAWSNFRNVAARDWKNLRVDPNGFLETRDGHRTVFDTEDVTQVYAYKTLLLAVIGNNLKWARARGRGMAVTFNDFSPALEIDTSAHYHFQPVSTAATEFVLVSNGTGDPQFRQGGPYYIDLTDVFRDSNPLAPRVYRCYLPNPNNPYGIRSKQVKNGNKNSDAEYQSNSHIEFYFQAVKTIGEQEGVPWVFDFTEQPYQNQPDLAPTLVVSEAIPLVDLEVSTPFVVAIDEATHTDQGSYNELTLAVTGVTGGGDTPASSVVVNTATTPDSIKAEGALASWAILPGSISVELTGYNYLLDWRSHVKLQARVNNGSWRTIGGENNWLNQNIFTSSDDEVSFNYNAHSFGRVPVNGVIEFRITATNGDISLIGSPTIRIQVQSGISVLTLADINEINAVGDGEGEDIQGEYNRQPRTEITFNLNLGAANADADYIDVYRSRRRVLPNPVESGYQLIARLPHQDQYQFTLKIPVHDAVLPDTWVDDLPEQGELVTWRYAESDQHRVYVVSPEENRLYLSYFDGIDTRHFMNLTDFVHLPTAGEPITGIKFLDDTYLAIYTSHRILLVYTDPAPELMRIQGQYSQGPRDESVGCIAPLSLVEIDQYHYFLSANKRLYRFGGRRPTWASASVQPLLEPLAIEESNDAQLNLSEAVAVAHKGFYLLSYPSLEEDPVGNDVYRPNVTMIYDIDRDKWYKDGFGVRSYAKDNRDRLYGIVEGDILALYDDDETDEEIEWEWHSNYLMMPPRTLIYNVAVKMQVPVDIEVTVRTEEGSQTQTIAAQDANDYWGQYAGFNLRGRTARISITGTGQTVIDRIVINEEVR